MSQASYEPASNDQLAREVRRLESGAIDSNEWVDAPEAIPRVRASTAISLRVPTRMLRILKLFAEREGVGYQVLMKNWLDERIREERDKLAARQGEAEPMFEGVGLSELLAVGN